MLELKHKSRVPCPKCGGTDVKQSDYQGELVYCNCDSCKLLWIRSPEDGIQSYVTVLGWKDVPWGTLPVFD